LVTAKGVHYTPLFMGKTLRRYLASEIGGAFLAGIAMFSSVLFLLRALSLIEMIFARGVPAALVLRLLGAILPSFLEAVLPMAFLLGGGGGLGRMASDHETLALRAAGLSLWSVLPPVLALSFVVAAATLALSMTARPWGHREIERTGFEIAKTRASAALRPRFFNTDFERMVVYVDRIDRASGDLEGVLLSDERGRSGRQTVFARRGRVGGHEDSGRLYLQLLDGTSVTSRENAADVDVTEFRSLDVSLELRTSTGNRPGYEEPAALEWQDLRQDLAGGNPRRATEAAIELHRRFSLAAATIVLALIGTALGFHPSPSARTRAVAASLAIILGFYALLTFAVASARSGQLRPDVALWMPNLVLLGVAASMSRRVARDRPPLPRLLPRRLPSLPRRSGGAANSGRNE
jgi:lipopolysaccharide export system permease protein